MSDRRSMILMYACALGTVGALVLTSSYKKTVEHHQREAEAAAAEQGSVGPSKASTFEQKLANLDKVR
ncbi:hypothetical protein KFL_002080010 [Klebsormidium nitens]|uniref:Uncharacterized protein n=1 Tax=Klebsormidium nitens TaxID=105231 RepID=A0A1Y1I1N2_KLENI|nr:hypothetical protein KFL_002080010 [Klebsormidium nitens]|eukprot:GAQ84824.1 hypothetical protein KFL_002080010 [Klebsormidium nitens]